MPLPQRKLHRLKTWDYGEPGFYFVTVCTKDKQKLLSTVSGNELDAQVKLTAIGAMVKETWEGLSKAASHVKTDVFCIMPNHLHGILIIEPHDIKQRRTVSDLVR